MFRSALLLAALLSIACMSQPTMADASLHALWRLNDADAEVDDAFETWGSTGPSGYGSWNESLVASVDLGDDFAYGRAKQESSVLKTSYTVSMESLSQARRSFADECFAYAESQFTIRFELHVRARFTLDGWLDASSQGGNDAGAFISFRRIGTGQTYLQELTSGGPLAFSTSGMLPRGIYQIEFDVLTITSAPSQNLVYEAKAAGYFNFTIPAPGALALMAMFPLAGARRRRRS